MFEFFPKVFAVPCQSNRFYAMHNQVLHTAFSGDTFPCHSQEYCGFSGLSGFAACRPIRRNGCFYARLASVIRYLANFIPRLPPPHHYT